MMLKTFGMLIGLTLGVQASQNFSEENYRLLQDEVNKGTQNIDYRSDYEREIVLKNGTDKTVLIKELRDFYSIMSDANIGSEFEIKPGEDLRFTIFIVLSNFYERSPLDGMKFQVLKEHNTGSSLFEIVWDDDVATTGDLKKADGYTLCGPIKENNDKRFVFTIS